MSGGCIYRWNGSAFAKVLDGDTDLDGFGAIYAIWGADSMHVWAVGQECILFWDGMAWTLPVRAEGVTFRSVWGRSATDVYVVGDTAGGRYLIHFDGLEWTVLDGVEDSMVYYSVNGT